MLVQFSTNSNESVTKPLPISIDECSSGDHASTLVFEDGCLIQLVDKSPKLKVTSPAWNLLIKISPFKSSYGYRSKICAQFDRIQVIVFLKENNWGLELMWPHCQNN